MGFLDALADFALAMGNPREWERRNEQARREGAYREAERQKRIRKLAELERDGGVDVAAMRDFVRQMQRNLDERTQHQRKRGNKVGLTPKVFAGTFSGQPAIGKFFERGDPNRLDIYYGGGTSNPLENEEHGHVVIDLRYPETPVKWFTPGPKHYREQLL